MAITFFPKAGMVLMCDFKDSVAPEMCKVRPVVVISPNSLVRHKLCTIVPLSTTEPNPIESYHYKLPNNPLKSTAQTWAKCDLVMSVSVDRLDRIKIARGKYEIAYVSMDQVRTIREMVGITLGLQAK